MISAGITDNSRVNGQLDRIARGPQTPAQPKSAGMVSALGLQVQAWFTGLGDLASKIGSTNLRPFGNPSAPAGGSQQAAAAATGSDKTKEASGGPKVEVGGGNEARKKVLEALRDADCDAKLEDVTPDMVRRYQKGDITLAGLKKEIKKAQDAKEKAEKEKAAAAEKKDTPKDAAAPTEHQGDGLRVPPA